MRKNKFLTKLSSAQYVRNTYVHIWPTNNLTQKQKKMFQKRTKLFSTELGVRLKKKQLSNLFSLKYRKNQVDFQKQNRQKYFVNKYKKFSEEKVFFIKSFWFLKKTSLIPGGVKIMRPKSFNLVKKNSLKTLKVYLKSIQKSKMQKLVSRTNNQMGFRHTWKFVHAIESLPLICMQKAFQYKNSFMVQPILAQNLKVNSANHLALPYKQMKQGDFFTNKHVNKSLYNSTLYQKILILYSYKNKKK